MPRLSDQAVCLRQWDWSETSQTLLLLTRDAGAVRGLAKGSRREGSSFCGGVEPMTVGTVLWISKPAGQLATITSWDLVQICPAIRRSLRAYAHGMYLAQVLSGILHEGDAHPQLFDALVEVLGSMDGSDGDCGRVAWFQRLALEDLGYRPELHRDVATRNEPLPHAPTYAFDARLGGLTVDRGNSRGTWRVRHETVQYLRDLATTRMEGGRAAHAGDTPIAVILRANRLMAAYFAEILGRELPTAAMAFSDGDGN